MKTFSLMSVLLLGATCLGQEGIPTGNHSLGAKSIRPYDRTSYGRARRSKGA